MKNCPPQKKSSKIVSFDDRTSRKGNLGTRTLGMMKISSFAIHKSIENAVVGRISWIYTIFTPSEKHFTPPYDDLPRSKHLVVRSANRVLLSPQILRGLCVYQCINDRYVHRMTLKMALQRESVAWEDLTHCGGEREAWDSSCFNHSLNPWACCVHNCEQPYFCICMPGCLIWQKGM